MSTSYLSQPAEYSPTKSSINLPLTLKVLEMKQGKYDVAKQQIQSTLDAFGQMQVLRPEDNEYIAAKLKDITAQINEFGEKDLSQSNVTDALMGKIKSVARDPFVLNAMQITAKVRKFDQGVATTKEKRPESYSDINYQDARKLAGLDKYMRGETDEIGALVYNDYVDVTKTTAEKIKQFKDLKGDEVIEVKDNAGNIQKRTIKGLTSNEIISYMPNLLSSQERSQLEINGRYRYSDNPNQAVVDLQSYKQKSLENFNKNIETYTKFANNTNVEEQERKRYDQLRIAEEQAKKMFESGIQGMEDNPSQAAGFLEQQSWMSNFATMAGARTSVEYEVDQGFYKARELELAYKKDAREDAKFELEVLKLQQETGQAGIGTSDVSLARIPDNQVQEVDVYNDVTKDFNGAIGEIKGIVGSVVQSKGVDSETLDLYNTALQDELNSGTPESIAMKRAFEKSGLSTSHPREYAQLIKTEAKRNKLGDVIAKADRAYTVSFEKNADKLLQNVEQALNAGGVQESIMRGIGNLGIGTSQIVNVGFEKDRADYSKEQNRLKEFVSANGGINNLKENIKNSPSKIKELSTILNSFAGKSYNFFTTVDLEGDTQKERSRIIAEQGQGIVTTLDIATITNEKVRERIVSAIPQTEGQQNFNAKLPLTIIPQSDGQSFVIRQEGGTKINASGKEVTQPTRTYTVTKSDDLFNILRPSLELQAEKREITATNTDYAIKNERINYLDQARTSTLQKTAQHIRNTVGESRLASNNPPEYYLTPELTQATLERSLAGKVAPQKIEQLVSLMATNPNDKFLVEAVPDQGTWTTRVVLKSGGVPILLSEGNTFKSKMDDQLLLYIKQYPQIMIGEAMLNYLKQKPQQVDTLLNRLQ